MPVSAYQPPPKRFVSFQQAINPATPNPMKVATDHRRSATENAMPASEEDGGLGARNATMMTAR